MHTAIAFKVLLPLPIKSWGRQGQLFNTFLPGVVQGKGPLRGFADSVVELLSTSLELPGGVC